MKKFSITLFIFLVLILTNVYSQRPVIELSFTAQYQSQHIPLDSIYIQNLTQPGDTMLYAPDTVLVLNYPVGLPEDAGSAKSSFSVSPNYPNPSIDGRTSIDVFIPEKEHVTMRIVNIRGSEVAFYENTLDAGIHHFIFLAGKEKYYVLSVNCGNEIRSIKMINAGNSGQSQESLVYNGSSEASVTLKSQNAITGFDFSLGDQLRFIGYAKTLSGIAGSDVIEATPAGNENYQFEILEGLPCPGIPAVTYEDQPYKTVLIGNQCWFKENLNVGTRIDGAGDQTDNSVIEKYCYNDDPSKCDIYGGLYQWNELMQYTTISGSQGLCPDGWHLPTNDEWTALTTFLGGVEFAGGKMKEPGLIHWNNPNTGATNESGFTGLPGGMRLSVGAFGSIGGSGTWWSSTEQSSNSVYDRGLSTYGSYVSVGTFIKPMGLSARCVNDDTFLSIPTVNTAGISEIAQTNATGGGEITNDGGAVVTARGVCWSTSQNPTIADSHTEDGTGTGAFVSILTGLEPGTQYFVKAYAVNSIGVAYGSEVSFTSTSSIFTCGDIVTYEGQNYHTIIMGTQCWFLDNLNVGIMVTQNQTNNGVVEKYCYNNDPANCEIYGGLYDWGEVMQYSTQPGIQAICPTGWHIPTDEEFTTLTDYISSQPAYYCDNSGFNNAKAIATNTGWDTSQEYCAVGNDQSANNASGFSGMPVGMRMDDGSGFSGAGNTTAWYSSTESSGFAAQGRMIAADYWFILTSMMSKNYGLSVRCLKDESTTTIPTVTTASISNISQISAIGGGDVTSSGGFPVTARGVCWSTSQNPTIDGSHSFDGTGAGPFVSILTYLSPNTLYFVRAYATNILGTAYGDEVSFTTLPGNFTCGNIVNYEGKDYNTLQFGTQCWFKENLNVGTMVTETQTNNGIIEKYCLNNNPAKCELYGGLYDWGEAMQYSTQPGIQAICPEGWHIPTDEEFTTFTQYISSQPEFQCDYNPSRNAKAIASTTGWDSSSGNCTVGNNQVANNASGFTGKPAGFRWDTGTGFGGEGYMTEWYSSTESSGYAAKGRLLAADYSYILTSNMSKNYGYSIRCLKDLTSANIPTVNTSGITNITQNTATGGGEVTDDGGTEVTARGVCWSTSTNPTIADSHTTDGTGTGSFVSSLTGLTANTQYYVRAYAVNNTGINYGNEVSFTTFEPDLLYRLTGNSSKVWKLIRVVSTGRYPLEVGPWDHSTIWWAMGFYNNELANRPCMLNDEWIFGVDGSMIYDAKGDYWAEGGVFEPANFCASTSDPMVGVNSEDLSAWAGGSFNFNVTEGEDPKLTVNGYGAFVGFLKLMNMAEVNSTNPITVPSTITYDIVKLSDNNADTLIIEGQYLWDNYSDGGYWRFVLMHYDNPEEEPPIPENQPYAVFTLDFNGLTMFCTNYSYYAESYLWDFGDGQTSTEENPVHTFASEGIYIVTLTAFNPNGASTQSQMAFVSATMLTDDILQGGAWRARAENNSIFVGPGLGNGTWWSCPKENLDGTNAGTPDDWSCLPDDEFAFSPGGVFTYNTNGSARNDAWWGNPTGCISDAAIAASPYYGPAFGSGTHSYTLTTSATSGRPIITLTNGASGAAFIGFMKGYYGGENTDSMYPPNGGNISNIYEVMGYANTGIKEYLFVSVDISTDHSGTAAWSIILER